MGVAFKITPVLWPLTLAYALGISNNKDMRIDPRRRSEVTTSRQAEKPKGVQGTPSFAEVLLEKEEAERNVEALELERLREQITDQGLLLDKNPTIGNFLAYRKLIQTLTQKVMARAFRLSKINQHRLRQVVVTIDDELAALYEELMKNEKDHLHITHAIVHIQGLVIELFL